MDAKVMRVRALGRAVAKAQDAALTEQSALREARALWLASEASPRPRGRAPRRPASTAALAVVAAIAAAVVLFIWFGRSPQPLAFDVGPAGPGTSGASAERGSVGEWIAAPQDADLPLHFSDGSVVHLGATARARVLDVDARGARIVLERGTARAEFVHREETRWAVNAGPFEIAVIGTAFDVTWDPTQDAFALVLERGRVQVSGCAMPRARVVTAGETFRAVCHDGRVVAAADAPPSGASPQEEIVHVIASPSVASAPVASASPASLPQESQGAERAAPAKATGWQDLLARGRHAEAVDAADTAGLSSICDSADADQLMRLADAARFVGRFDHAEVILHSVRRRFPGDERAAVAAFELGRIAFDVRQAYAEAAQWFHVYLSERPSGALARESAGRRIEALERSGDHARAREAAQSYLKLFPTGPHADVARSIVGP